MNRIKDEVESENQRLEEIRIRKIKHREDAQAKLIDQRHRILEIREKIVNVRKKFDVPASPETPNTPSTPLNLQELISPELPASLPNILKKQLEVFEGRLYKMEDDFDQKKSYVTKLDMDYAKLEEKIKQNKIKIQNINRLREKQFHESKRSGFNFPGSSDIERGKGKFNLGVEGKDSPELENDINSSIPSFESPLKGPKIHQHVIASILFVEFEKEKGSRIKFQVPPESVSEEEFEHFAKYITGTEEFCQEILAFSYKHRFFLGLPKVLRHERYPRNLFLFNVVFVFNKPVPDAPPVMSPKLDSPFTPLGSAISNRFDHEIRRMKVRSSNIRGFEIGKIMLLYVPILKKLSDALYSLEEQKQMLSCPENFKGVTVNHDGYANRNPTDTPELEEKRPSHTHGVLEEALTKFYVEITFEKETYLRFDNTSFVHFKLLPHSVQPSPPILHPHYVPVPLYDLSHLVDDDSDLTFQQIYRHLNGRNHIQSIVEKSGVVIRLVYRCVKTLLYYNVVKIIDIFQYSNIYGLKSQETMARIFHDHIMQQKCYDYVVLHHRKRYSPATSRRIMKNKRKKEQQKSSKYPKHPWPTSSKSSNSFSNSSNSNSNSNSPSSNNKPSRSSNNNKKKMINPLQIVKIYSYFNSRDSVRTVLQRIPPEVNISHRALITFGVIHGLLVRIHEIPIVDENFHSSSSSSHASNFRTFEDIHKTPNKKTSNVLYRRPETPPLKSDSPRTNKYSRRMRQNRGYDDKGEVESEMRRRERFFSSLRMFLNGNHCMDEICCFFHIPKEQVMAKMMKEYGDSLYIVRKIIDEKENRLEFI